MVKEPIEALQSLHMKGAADTLKYYNACILIWRND